MKNNYKIIRTIFENVFQRVLECKDDETGEVFYSNIITSQKVINLINLEELKKVSSNVLDCYNTEDRIYIYTKPFNEEYRGIREQLANNLTLKQQFTLSESVIGLAQNIFNMTDVVQQKILDLDKLYVDSDNKVHVNCNLIFEQEYDIADNETFKRLGNIIHFIFSGTEIVDYNISDAIPPDILKIIVRCLTREYIFPNDVVDELRNSPIYAMIFGTDIKENVSKVSTNNKKVISEKQLDTHGDIEPDVKEEEYTFEAEKDEEDDGVFNIFVNDNSPPPPPLVKKKNKFNRREFVRGVTSIAIVVVVLLLGNKLIKTFTNSEPANSDNIIETQNPPSTLPPTEEGANEPSDNVDITDSTELYFNEGLLNSIGYSGNTATIDNNIYVEGKNSLVVSNEVDEKVKSLFAAVDFKNDKFNYMLKKQIGISLKMKSETDMDGQIVLEAYKDGAMKSNFHINAKIYNDMWSPFTVPINVTDADSLNIYIEYSGKNKVWVDSIYIDVIK